MKSVRHIINGNFSIDIGDLPVYKLPEEHCQHQSLPSELGIGQSDSFQLDQDLCFIDTHYIPSTDLAILSKIDNQEPRLIVTLGLQGHSRFRGQNGDEFYFKKGYTTITTFKTSLGEREYQANKPIRQLRFSISKHWIETYFGEIKSAAVFSNKAQQLTHQPISAQGLQSSKHLIARDSSRLLFIHGQAMTLLASELAPLFEDDYQHSNQYYQKDKAIAELARDILLDEFKNPPSIAELSKKSGTNQFKLKKLFHLFFNNTPYGLLFEYRMNKAYQLLETTTYQVGVVADLVGYSHASNFTSAFTAHFGIPPKVVARKN